MSAQSAYQIESKGSYVNIKYSVRVAHGQILKGAEEPEIMDFVTGYLQVVPGLEKNLLGKTEGEKLSFTIPAEEAFGPKYDELIIEKPKSDFHFPGEFKPFIGMELPLITSKDHGPDTAVIREIKENTIVIDANHPLAGLALEYDLEIVEARKATEKDICSGWEETLEGGNCSDGSCSSPCELVLGNSDN
jgi:FKBP-type peptidyl-prolyl cis-trans isomerase SlyD